MKTKHKAFTLVEILIVIALIVLLLAMAVPAFNLISGGKSIEGAANQLSAALGRARAQAIGLQKTTGVMFFIDQRSGRRSLAIVQETDAPAIVGAGTGAPDVWLDLVEADYLPLPAGIGVQVIHDCQMTTSTPVQRSGDGYIGFNANTCHDPSTGVVGRAQDDPAFGGVILFDGSGRLVSSIYGFKCYNGNAGTPQLTAIGRMLYPKATDPPTANSIHQLVPGQAGVGIFPVRSAFGLVMFRQDAFESAGGDDVDDKIKNNTYSVREKDEEDWLDKNATALMVNRYNGTLVKGE